MTANRSTRAINAAAVVALLTLGTFAGAARAQAAAIVPPPHGKPPASPGHIGPGLRLDPARLLTVPSADEAIRPLHIEIAKVPDGRMSLGPQPFQGPIFGIWSPLDYCPAGRGRYYSAPFYERNHADYGLAGMLLLGMNR